MRRKRRNHSPAFKVKVALAALQGDETLAQLASQYDVHVNQIQSRRNQLKDLVVSADYAMLKNGDSCITVRFVRAI